MRSGRVLRNATAQALWLIIPRLARRPAISDAENLKFCIMRRLAPQAFRRLLESKLIRQNACEWGFGARRTGLKKCGPVNRMWKSEARGRSEPERERNGKTLWDMGEQWLKVRNRQCFRACARVFASVHGRPYGVPGRGHGRARENTASSFCICRAMGFGDHACS